MQFNTQTGRLSSNLIRIFSVFFIILCISIPVFGQMITGVWKGKINRQKAEVKIIQNRDSLTGTAYYFENQNNYRRYSIKGYFNSQANEVIWWDDQLLEEKSGRINLPFSNPGNPMMSAADFNCPGGKKMFLNGKASTKTKSNTEGSVSLEKTDSSLFIDEWDFIIDNYTTGANNPQLIDSIEKSFVSPVPDEQPIEKITKAKPVEKPSQKKVFDTPEPSIVKIDSSANATQPAIPNFNQEIQNKFLTRHKIFIKEIPVTGDSIELKFYDNAEIDGDSISLFLNDKLIIKHLRLAAQPYIIKLAVAELDTTNELVMVAENMGSIPPNTSYMIALVDDQRHDAYLTSTEGSSAMIRFVKKQEK